MRGACFYRRGLPGRCVCGLVRHEWLQLGRGHLLGELRLPFCPGGHSRRSLTKRTTGSSSSAPAHHDRRGRLRRRGGSKAGWIPDAYHGADHEEYPRIRAVAWFRKGSNRAGYRGAWRCRTAPHGGRLAGHQLSGEPGSRTHLPWPHPVTRNRCGDGDRISDLGQPSAGLSRKRRLAEAAQDARGGRATSPVQPGGLHRATLMKGFRVAAGGYYCALTPRREGCAPGPPRFPHTGRRRSAVQVEDLDSSKWLPLAPPSSPPSVA